jgi:hypothetical protein
MSVTPDSGEQLPPPPAVTRAPVRVDASIATLVPPFIAGRGAAPRPAPAQTAAVSYVETVSTTEPASAADTFPAAVRVDDERPQPPTPVPAPPDPVQSAPAPWWGNPSPTIANSVTTGNATPEHAHSPASIEVTDDESPQTGRGEFEGWELLEEEGSAEPAYGDEVPLIDGGREEFPLDAFIIPEHSQRLPTGYEEELAAMGERVAERLEDIARQIRARGIGSFGDTHDTDELSRILAALIAGYVSHAH